MKLVVKLGGEVIEGEEGGRIAREIADLVQAGHELVVVHGGGPQATALSKRLGIQPQIVNGRRITDAATLEVMKATLGRVNIDLCAALQAAGVRSVGLHGAVRARRRLPMRLPGAGAEPVDLGWVGDITAIDTMLLEQLVVAGYLPVLACLGTGEEGEIYNINADVVATRLAATVGADVLLFVTGVGGVLRDVRDPSTRLARLSVAEGRAAIAAGEVSGGMIPKLEESFTALSEGARAILIVGGELARAVREPGSVGTWLVY